MHGRNERMRRRVLMSREAKKWNVLAFNQISSCSKNHASFDVTIPYRLQRILDKETIFREYRNITIRDISTYAKSKKTDRRLNQRSETKRTTHTYIKLKFLPSSFKLKSQKRKDIREQSISDPGQGVIASLLSVSR